MGMRTSEMVGFEACVGMMLILVDDWSSCFVVVVSSSVGLLHSVVLQQVLTARFLSSSTQFSEQPYRSETTAPFNFLITWKQLPVFVVQVETKSDLTGFDL